MVTTPNPSSFWVLSKVTLRPSLSLQGQWLLQPKTWALPLFLWSSQRREVERRGLTLTKPGCWLSPSRIQPCGHLSTQRRLELGHHLPLLPPVAAVLPEPPRAGAGLSCMLARSLQSSPTLCDPKDYSLPGTSVPGRFTRQEYWCGLPCPPLRGFFPT